MSSASIDKAIDRWLPRIDDQLASQGILVSARPLQAAMTFRRLAITEVHPVTSGPEWEQDWFAVLYTHVERWYREHYKTTALRSDKSTISGVVDWRGTPFLVHVSLSFATPGPRPNTMWLWLPNRTFTHEQRVSWLAKGPRKSALSKGDRKLVDRRITAVANALRSVNINLNTANHFNDKPRRMATTILPHLGTAADHICSLQPGQLSLAAWELHMAIEKVMKVYLMQHSIQPGTTHRLDKLRDLAASHGLLVPKDPRFFRLPTDKQAIAHRYAELDSRLPVIAMKDYRTVVSLTRAYSGAMKRTLTMRNARLLLKKPPWFRFTPLR